MKIRDIILTANANTMRSKLRTTLTIIAIFIGAFTLTLTNGLGSGISTYIDDQVNSIGAKDVLIIMPKDSAGGFETDDTAPKTYDPNRKVAASDFGGTATALTEADITKISKVDGIKSVEPSITVAASYIQGMNGQKFQLSVDPYITGANTPLAYGSEVDNKSSEHQIILPPDYAKALGFADDQAALGKQVTIGVTDSTGVIHEETGVVKGVRRNALTGGVGVNTNTAYTKALDRNQKIGLPAAATDSYQFLIAKFDDTKSQADTDALKKRLDEQGYSAKTIEDQIGTFKSVITGIILVLNAFAVIALLAAGFGIINTLLMSVQERTKEIGLMKAMGMSGSKIFLLFSAEAITLGFWGSFIGVLVAAGLGNVINKFATEGPLKDLDGLQLLIFPLPAVATIIGIVMVIAFLAGTLPAYRAARQSPIDSLRYE